MKKLYYLLSIALITIFASCGVSRNYAQPAYYGSTQAVVTYQQFYDELSPYGNWISYPGYGYVWQPGIAGFQPYATGGYWVYSTYGWTWASSYRWGWAPFHYGRWTFDVGLGWLWIPGYEWAPAWVSWRGGSGYYGWAPLGPGMSINVSISLIPRNYWSFVPGRYITSRNLNNYYVKNNTTIINNTTVINNNYYYGSQNNQYNSGPSVRDVESVANTKIALVRVVSSSAPGVSRVSGSTVSMYRPAVSSNNNQSKPATVVNRSAANSSIQSAPTRSVDAMNDTRIPSGVSRSSAVESTTPTRTLGNENDNNSRSSAGGATTAPARVPATPSNSNRLNSSGSNRSVSPVIKPGTSGPAAPGSSGRAVRPATTRPAAVAPPVPGPASGGSRTVVPGTRSATPRISSPQSTQRPVSRPVSSSPSRSMQTPAARSMPSPAKVSQSTKSAPVGRTMTSALSREGSSGGTIRSVRR